MCGTENRTELPLSSAGSAYSCCSSQSSSSSMAAPMDAAEFAVEGMTCGHCVQTVEKAVAALAGVESVAVELVPGGRSRLLVGGAASDAAVREAVASAGYIPV